LIDNNNVLIDLPSDIAVLADPLLLDRAISNILRNCVRYAGQFGPIKAKAVCEGSQVVLTIIDNGPGVSEEALKHLAQPFYRPEPSRNRSSGGFGLGLAIVKSCIEACQGSLAVRNNEPRGLAVELRLKIANCVN
jgi:two-component system sensor histidine kinase CpxA